MRISMKLRSLPRKSLNNVQSFFEVVLHKHKKLAGAVLIAPISWLLFRYGGGCQGNPPLPLLILAMVGPMVASFWLGYRATQRFRPAALMVAKNRIEQERPPDIRCADREGRPHGDLLAAPSQGTHQFGQPTGRHIPGQRQRPAVLAEQVDRRRCRHGS